MLLKPNKNADPDLTIMATSTFLLKELKKNQFEKITELRLALMKKQQKCGCSARAVARTFIYSWIS
jgi:hypothetical protein